MLEILLDKYVLYVLMWGAAACGIFSKFVVSVTLKRLVKASGNMGKSTHPLMRLVRAKFEHACMISEKVENVRVFVDKYLYEYKVAGVKLHSWRRMEGAASGACFLLGIAGAVIYYSMYGMQDEVLKIGAMGAGLAILVFLVHLTTDENFRLEAVRNYMVDYLENICLHRYERAYQKEQKEIKVMSPEVPVPEFGEVPLDKEKSDKMKDRLKDVQEPMRPRPAREVPSPEMPQQLEPPVMPEPYEVPNATPPAVNMKELKDAKKDNLKEALKPEDKDVLIRQILEEFMA